MVNVPVDNDDAFTVVPQSSGSNCDVIDETESHRSIGERVMARRTNKRECTLRPSRIDFVDRSEYCSCGSPSSFKRAARRIRVGVELATPCLRIRNQHFEVLTIMRLGKVVD